MYNECAYKDLSKTNHKIYQLKMQGMKIILYVAGFGKIVPVHTRIKIHFIAYYNSHTQALYPDTVTQLL